MANMKPKPKMSNDAIAIIKAIQEAQKAAQTVANEVEDELRRHTQDDDKRFEQLTVLVESIANDVKSLLSSRQFFRGAGWAVAGLASLFGAGIAAIWHYFKG